MVVNFELFHRFEADQKQSRIFKLPDGVHLVPLHYYLPLTERLQQMCRRQNKNTELNQIMTVMLIIT